MGLPFKLVPIALCVIIYPDLARADYCDELINRFNSAPIDMSPLECGPGLTAAIEATERQVDYKIEIGRQIDAAQCPLTADSSSTSQLIATAERIKASGKEFVELCKSSEALEQATDEEASSSAKNGKWSEDRAVSCSSISGIKGASQTTQTCLKAARWTSQRPYNQASEPIRFQPANGPAITIPSGWSLWSVPLGSSNSRQLEARPWSGNSQAGGCRAESKAKGSAFEVGLLCEIGRQANLANEQQVSHASYGSREDSLDFVDSFNCKKPWTAEYMPGWQDLPASYWKSHPDQAVGKCIGPSRDGRREEKKLREPNWLTAGHCEILHPDRSITTNKRGIRGCNVPTLK
nr:hypothetical protein [Mesorhizobium sp.]